MGARGKRGKREWKKSDEKSRGVVMIAKWSIFFLKMEDEKKGIGKREKKRENID